ncbi:MAG: protein phosphatase 2C domain-containing protein [Pseudomonadota bacterium]
MESASANDNLVLGQLVPVSDGPERLTASVGGGSAEIYCNISPDKASDNQDSLMLLQLDDDRAVLAVADGAGGIEGGRRASRLALKMLRDVIVDPAFGHDSLRNAIISGIEHANAAVMSATRGAATTLTVVSIEGREARVFHIGDSFALITGQRSAVKLQTVAHSPVGFAIAAGFLTEEQAIYHPERHIVSNFVGTDEMVIEVGAPITLAKRDTVLVASDGLTDNLHMAEITDMMRRGKADQTLDAIVSLARSRMTHREQHQPGKADDLAVILFRKP